MAQNHKAIAQHTLNIIEAGYYINTHNEKIELKKYIDDAVNNTKLFTPEELDVLLAEIKSENIYAPQFEVANETTLDAARRLAVSGEEDILCLNFASAKNPVGVFLVVQLHRKRVLQELLYYILVCWLLPNITNITEHK